MSTASERIQPPMKSTRVRKFRVDFEIPNPNEKEADTIPYKNIGMVKLVLHEDDVENLEGIAFRRADPKCLKATKLRVFEL